MRHRGPPVKISAGPLPFNLALVTPLGINQNQPEMFIYVK